MSSLDFNGSSVDLLASGRRLLTLDASGITPNSIDQRNIRLIKVIKDKLCEWAIYLDQTRKT